MPNAEEQEDDPQQAVVDHPRYEQAPVVALSPTIHCLPPLHFVSISKRPKAGANPMPGEWTLHLPRAIRLT